MISDQELTIANLHKNFEANLVEAYVQLWTL